MVRPTPLVLQSVVVREGPRGLGECHSRGEIGNQEGGPEADFITEARRALLWYLLSKDSKTQYPQSNGYLFSWNWHVAFTSPIKGSDQSWSEPFFESQKVTRSRQPQGDWFRYRRWQAIIFNQPSSKSAPLDSVMSHAWYLFCHNGEIYNLPLFPR